MRLTIRTLVSNVTFLLLITSCVVRSPNANGEETTETLGNVVHDFADREVSRYKISLNDDESLMRVPRSLLRWSNSTRIPAFGDTYIWTNRGCARAIISIFALGAPRNSIAVECQSLSESPFTMRREDAVVWAPSTPGLEPKPVANVRPPAATRTARTVQMNRIARQFRADFALHTSPDEYTPLRLLSKPLFRYESEDPEILDGAVYGFVDATDPEILLVIEARRRDGKTSWVYSPARSRHDHLRLYVKDEIVWEGERLAPPWDNIRDPKKPYFNLRLDKMLPPTEWARVSEMFAVE